jgi:hypothetical protein
MTDEERRLKRNEYMRLYRKNMSPERKKRAISKVSEWKKSHRSQALDSSRKSHRTHRVQELEYTRKWRQENPGVNAIHCKSQRDRLLAEVIEAYGGICSCRRCDEVRPLFLTIDHVNNDGAAERRGLGDGPSPKSKKGRAGVNFYRWLKKNGFPRDRYRLMCFNCNCGRARNKGVCPHEVAS